MGKRQIIFLALAAFVGIGMILLARNLMAPAPVAPTAAAQQAAVEITKVLVAVKQIPSGSFLSPGDVEWRSWPKDSPTDGLIVKESSAEKDYIGAVARMGIKVGEPILRANVTKPNEGGFLAAVLQPGMRAMTIKVSAISGIAGLIFPNDRVDVILAQKLVTSATGDEGDIAGDRRVSETVLENVRVLALDQKTDDLKKEPKVAELATLEVSSKQAEKLALISQMGTLSLVLRSVANEVVVEPTTSIDELAATVAADVPPLPMTLDSEVSNALQPLQQQDFRGHRVQIIRGREATEVVVPNSYKGGR